MKLIPLIRCELKVNLFPRQDTSSPGNNPPFPSIAQISAKDVEKGTTREAPSLSVSRASSDEMLRLLIVPGFMQKGLPCRLKRQTEAWEGDNIKIPRAKVPGI